MTRPIGQQPLSTFLWEVSEQIQRDNRLQAICMVTAVGAIAIKTLNTTHPNWVENTWNAGKKLISILSDDEDNDNEPEIPLDLIAAFLKR